MISLLLALALQGAQVDADFPGGNIVVDKTDGDQISLHQDLRDTAGDWFYWQFRVRGAKGRTLTFQFAKGNVIGVLGPAVSRDGGVTWTWLGAGSVKGTAFTAAIDADDVRFCVSIPYQEADLRRFLARHDSVQVETLCETKKGRKVERLRVGSGPARILLTARHHACETIASYVMEGILEEALADEGFLKAVEIAAIPFMDKDGVEDGDQGKNRKPRDHNRDYDGESLYASTKALREFAPKWSDGRLKFALDLHCPTLRGANNETIYFVGSENPDNWKKVERFCGLLESTQTGPLKYSAKDNVPFGTAWNSAANYTKGVHFSRWAMDLPGAAATTTLEISYANANGKTVTADSARAFGRDLARALRKFLEQP
jgi:hypothetical protein